MFLMGATGSPEFGLRVLFIHSVQPVGYPEVLYSGGFAQRQRSGQAGGRATWPELSPSSRVLK